MSAVFAAWGVLLHGAVVISGEGAPLKSVQLTGVSRYGHILVAWTLPGERFSDVKFPVLCSFWLWRPVWGGMNEHYCGTESQEP